jgi:hypothetical protein
MITQEMVNSSIYLRRVIREYANSRNNMPIDVVDGDNPPKVTGSGYYWTTPSGKTIIRHPNAYKWPKLYNRSTISIEVGSDFIWKLLLQK